MAIAASKPVTLSEFLQRPETQPPCEFVRGHVIQKPMPQGKHSRLQLKIAQAVNGAAEAERVALAFPELRCTFGGRSIAPDIAVFAWSRIPFEADGEVPNVFEQAPDWVIEILSPDQSQTRIIDKMLFCLQHNSALGWIVDPEEKAVICYEPDRLPLICRGDDRLPVLAGVALELSASNLFGWLRPGG